MKQLATKKFPSSPWKTFIATISLEQGNLRSKSTANANCNSMIVAALQATAMSSAVYSISASATSAFFRVEKK